MKRYALVTSVLTLAIVGTAGAQTRPTTIARPAIDPSVAKTIARPGTINGGSATSSTGGSSTTAFMASGPYQLDLHAQKRNGQVVNVSDLMVQTGVTRTGNAVSVVSSDLSLTGTATGNQLHVSGPSTSGGTLTLLGSPGANGSASGTFTSADGGVTRTGTFVLYPGLNMGPNTTQRKIQNYGDPKPGSDDGSGTCGFWCQFFKWF